MRKEILIFILTSLFITTACQVDTPLKQSPVPPPPNVQPPEITPPKEEPTLFQTATGTQQNQFMPMVDILFVIDNSNSMADEQLTLRKNISIFIQNILKGNVIDLHVGVTSVWDEKLMGAYTPDNVKHFAKGQLRPVDYKDAQLPYWRRTDKSLNEDMQTLDKLLNIGTLDYREGGPENEEIFSPIVAALSPDNPNNTGFLRPGAHLVIIIMTDSDDPIIPISEGSASLLDARALMNKLIDVKKNDGNNIVEKIMTYIVALDREKVSTNRQRAEAQRRNRDPILQVRDKKGYFVGAENLKELQRVSQGQWLNLHSSDFGKRLANFGTYIRTEALKEIIVPIDIRPLTETPDGKDSIIVKFGNKILNKKYWKYHPDFGIIIISGFDTVKIPDEVSASGAAFTVEVIGADTLGDQSVKF